MLVLISFFVLCASVANGVGVSDNNVNITVSMKPHSHCCNLPELGSPEVLLACSRQQLSSHYCSELECLFQESGLLVNNNTVNKEAYKDHILKFARDNQKWQGAVDYTVESCINREPSQDRDQQNSTCAPLEMLACTAAAMLVKCPDEEWHCGH